MLSLKLKALRFHSMIIQNANLIVSIDLRVVNLHPILAKSSKNAIFVPRGAAEPRNTVHSPLSNLVNRNKVTCDWAKKAGSILSSINKNQYSTRIQKIWNEHGQIICWDTVPLHPALFSLYAKLSLWARTLWIQSELQEKWAFYHKRIRRNSPLLEMCGSSHFLSFARESVKCPTDEFPEERK